MVVFCSEVDKKRSPLADSACSLRKRSLSSGVTDVMGAALVASYLKM